MKLHSSLAVLALSLSLAGCARSDDPAGLVASAKDYIGKRDYKASIIQLKNALQKDPNNAEARYLLGFASLESGDHVSAEVELNKASRLGFNADELQVALARALLMKGDAVALVTEFGAKNLSTPKAQADLRALVGSAELARNRREQAQTAFAEALAVDPSNASAQLGLARLAAGQRDWQTALKRADSALAAAPANYEALILKADLLAVQGDPEPATKAYRAAIEVASENATPRLSLINHLVRQRALDQAWTEVVALQKVAPRDLRSLYAKALVLSEQRKFAEARETILQVLKSSPEHVPSLTLAGLAAFEIGAYAEAESHLRKAVFKAPEAIGAKRMLAATHLRMGQTEVALGEVRELLAQAGRDPNILALAAEAHLASGDVAGATKHYEQAKALAPENPRLQTRLAMVRFAAGDPGKGFAELEATSAAHSDDYQADLALIATHLRQRQPDKALNAVAALEKKQPNNPLTHNLRGAALLLKKDAAGARASFEHALQLNPTYMPAIANLARLDMQQKKPEDAKKRYEAVVKKQPNNEQALLGLAVLMRLTGANPQEIEKLLRQSIASNPSSPTARAALVNHHLRSRDFNPALVAAQDAATALPNNPAMVETLGMAQLAAGENRQAAATFTRLAEMLPKSPQPHVRLASASMALKQPDEAIRALRAALQLQPDLLAAQRDIAAIYISTGRAEQALKEARSVQADKPKQPFGYVLEGEVYAAQKKWDAAERVYREALKKFDLPALAVRAHALMEAAGKPAEADAFADKWVQAHAKDAFMLNYLAERDLAAKRYESAAKRYKAALTRAPDNPLVLNNLAWVAHELKQPNALEYAERANEMAPDNPAIMDTLGGILFAKGETDRGLELLGRAAEGAPQAYGIRLNFAKALLKADRKSAARKELEPLSKLDGKNPVQQEAARLLAGL